MSRGRVGRPRLRLPLVFARRFARSRDLARSSTIVAVLALFLLSMYVLLESMTLSPQQVVDRELGRFDRSTGLLQVSLPPGEADLVRRLDAAVREAGADDVLVGLLTVDMQIASREAPSITFYEAAWSSRPFPDRYRLESGRWPARPGEVVLTNADPRRHPVGSQLPVLSDRARFNVVGLAEDPYARSSKIMAGEGTWATLDPDIAASFSGLSAQPVVRWDGKRPQQVIQAVADVLVRHAGAGSPKSVRRTLAESVLTRSELANQETSSAIEKIPAGYTVPSLLLPGLSVLLVYGINDRRFRSRVRLMSSLGLPRWKAVGALGLATTAWCLIAAAVGAVAGVGLGGVLGRLVRVLFDHPIAPVPNVTGPLVQMVAVTLLAAGLGTLLLQYSRPSTAQLQPRASRTITAPHGRHTSQRGRDARHVFAVAAGCATVLLASRMDSPPKSMVMAATFALTVLLLTPDIVMRVLPRLPETGPRVRLARRQLASDSRRMITAVAMLASLLGMSLGFLTLLDTMIRTAGEQAYPDVLPGQLVVADRSSIGLPAPRRVLDIVRNQPELRDQEPIPLQFIRKGINADTRITLGNSDGRLLAVDDEQQLSRMISRPLTTSERRTLQAGGIVTWADGPAPMVLHPGVDESDLVVLKGDTVVHNLGTRPVAVADVPMAGWRSGSTGVMLTATARQLDLPIRTGAVMYTAVPDTVAAAVRRAVALAGENPRVVEIFKPPPPPVPPTALYVTAGGLVIVTLLLTAVVTRGQARSLRDYLGLLRTIGLPPRWVRHVLLYQHAVILAISTVVALIIAVLPVIVTAMRLPDFVFAIPWRQLAVLAAAVYAATFAAAHLTTRRLSRLSHHSR